MFDGVTPIRIVRSDDSVVEPLEYNKLELELGDSIDGSEIT